jgi:hypothetical protein
VISFETGAPLTIFFRKLDCWAQLIETQHDYEPPINGFDQLFTRVVPEVAMRGAASDTYGSLVSGFYV